MMVRFPRVLKTFVILSTFTLTAFIVIINSFSHFLPWAETVLSRVKEQ